MDQVWHFLDQNEATQQQAVAMSGSGFAFQTNTTYDVINHLKFNNAKSVRTSGIILASFNAAIGLVMAIAIFWDCYLASRRAVSRFRLYASIFKIVGPADMFPFVLSIGILTQGVIFAIAQARGLDGLLILGCQPISQVILPATFIVTYLQFVFGMETLIRALRPGPFPKMSTWTFVACITVTVAGLLGTYAVSIVYKAPNFCFGTLFFFIQRWSFQVFIVLLVITSFLFVGAIAIHLRLGKGRQIAVMERKAVSSMVLYMILGVLTNALVMPFFGLIALGSPEENQKIRLKLSMMAMVSANLTGILNGSLYLFLRTCHHGGLGRKGYHEFEKTANTDGRRRRWPPPRLSLFPRRAPSNGSTNTSLDNVTEVDEIVCSPSGFTPSNALTYITTVASALSPIRPGRSHTGSITTLNSSPIELPADLDMAVAEEEILRDDENVPILGVPRAPPAVSRGFYSPFPNKRSIQGMPTARHQPFPFPSAPAPAPAPAPVPAATPVAAPAPAPTDSRPNSQARLRPPRHYWSPDSFNRMSSARSSVANPSQPWIPGHTRQSSLASARTLQIGLRVSHLRALRANRSEDLGYPPPVIPPHPLATVDAGSPVTMRPRMLFPSAPSSVGGKRSNTSSINVDKKLPPVPMDRAPEPPAPVAESAEQEEEEEEELVYLTPAVYVPPASKKTASPGKSAQVTNWSRPVPAPSPAGSDDSWI